MPTRTPTRTDRPEEPAVDLDDQLAALAAGELDEQTARALRARAAADPAVGRRLARLEELEQQLRGWVPPSMSDAAADRLAARLQAALDELDDAPLAGRAATPLVPRAGGRSAERSSGAGPGAGGPLGVGGGDVVDLGAARLRRGLPSWAPGLAVAAALTAVVGTGIVMGGLPGSSDSDMLAQEATDAPVEESLEADAADEAGTTAMDAPVSGSAEAGGAAVGEASRISGVVLEEGELLVLAEDDPSTYVAPQGGDGEEADQRAASAEACLGVALERDTAASDGREVLLLADGSYAGEPAAFVVLRTAGDPALVTVLAYAPGDCTLLGSEETTG